MRRDRNGSAGEIGLAFRGTEMSKWKDVLADVNLLPVSPDPEGSAATSILEKSEWSGGVDRLERGYEMCEYVCFYVCCKQNAILGRPSKPGDR